ncbi:MAG: WG repeat-containing protein [Rikenellaceae bacterium]
MHVTITNFISALHAPSDYLQTLFEATIESGEKVSRTKDFADVFIEWHDKRYLISLPLSEQALRKAQTATVKLRTLRSKLLLDYRVLPRELNYVDSRGTLHNADLLLQEVPAGKLLYNCIKTMEAQPLNQAITRLESELKRLNLSLPNLKAENIIVAEDGQLYPIRLHYSTLNSECSREIECLRSFVAETLHFDPEAIEYINKNRKSTKKNKGEYEVEDKENEENEENEENAIPQNALYGYKSVGNPFEGMCVAENHEGYGYIGTDGQEIIPPKYLWAGDMREGRAEVETTEGMGLIDALGNYIIEPHYQIVDFDPNTGLSRVKQNDEWSTLDYQGRKI